MEKESSKFRGEIFLKFRIFLQKKVLDPGSRLFLTLPVADIMQLIQTVTMFQWKNLFIFHHLSRHEQIRPVCPQIGIGVI